MSNLKLAGTLLLALSMTAWIGCSDITSVADEAGDGITTASKMGDIAQDTEYKLNIIGVSKDKTAPMDDNNGRRIFVQLYGGQEVCNPDVTDPADPDFCVKCDPAQTDPEAADFCLLRNKNSNLKFDDLSKVNKILLTPDDTEPYEFAVLDANATDQNGAEFQMPVNVAPSDGSVEGSPVQLGYTVYARALGKPGGSAEITTCADEAVGTDTTDLWCSMNSTVLTRTTGKNGSQKPQDVTSTLLYLDVLVDPDFDSDLSTCLGGAPDNTLVDDPAEEFHVPLFNICFENYFWNYDNNGLKLVQLWFVPNEEVPA